MKLYRFIIVFIAVSITMLFAWQANMAVNAKPATPVCRGTNLLVGLKTTDPAAYQLLLEAEKKIENGNALLWKVEREGASPSYLFGTMHMSDKRLVTLPSPVQKALDGSRLVVLEIGEMLDENKMQQQVIKNIRYVVFTDGRTLESVLDKDQLASVKSMLKKYHTPYAAARMMQPWFVAVSMALPLCEVNRKKAGFEALDITIARKGKNNGAKIVGLETVGEQFAAFSSISISDQKEFLLSTIAMLDGLEDQIETMKQLYFERRIGALWPFTEYLSRSYAKSSNADKSETDRKMAVMKRFKQQLVKKRNYVMAKRTVPLLQKGSAFIAVGAMHLPGKHGLVSLLRQKGYNVSAVY